LTLVLTSTLTYSLTFHLSLCVLTGAQTRKSGLRLNIQTSRIITVSHINKSKIMIVSTHHHTKQWTSVTRTCNLFPDVYIYISGLACIFPDDVFVSYFTKYDNLDLVG